MVEKTDEEEKTKRGRGRPRKYKQPFVEIIDPGEYPEIRDLVRHQFRDADSKVQMNLHNILCNLLITPSVAISRSKGFYGKRHHPGWHTYTYSIRAQDMLADKGLVTMKKGYRSKKRNCNGYFEKGFSTTLTATETLDNLLNGVILKPVKIDSSNHPNQTLEGEPIDLEDLNKWTLFPEILNPLEEEYLKTDEETVSKLNEDYFSGVVLGFQEGSIHPIAGLPFEVGRDMFRNMSFNEKDSVFMTSNVFFTSMFTPMGCGRLYQRCHNSFQNISKGLRKMLAINGNPSAEVDYTSMHVNLAYYLAGAENPHLEDSYGPVANELGFEETPELRNAIKKCILIAFNTPDVLTCARAFNYNHKKDSKVLSELGIKTRDVYEAFIKMNPELDDVFNDIQDRAHVLMFHESSIMKNCLSAARQGKINALPIHDAIVCEKGYEKQIKEIMEDEYRKYTGNDIIAKVK